jgi:hypothetical protein
MYAGVQAGIESAAANAAAVIARRTEGDMIAILVVLVK